MTTSTTFGGPAPQGDSRFCYVVLAHTDPEGVLALVRDIRALSPSASVVVRHDDPAFIDPARLREAGALPLLSRIRVAWGDWTLAEAMLEAFEFALTATDAEHVVLVSGQDRPVLDLAAWEGEVRSLGADAVLDPHPNQRADWMYRWSSRRLPRTGSAGLDRVLRWGLCRIGDVTAPVLRLHTAPRQPDLLLYGGRRLRTPPVTVTKCSQWMTLNRRAARAVLDRDRADARVRRFFVHTRIPDESYVQSLLHDEPGLRIAYSETTTKVFEEGSASPAWIDVGTLERMVVTSAAPFVRKLPVDAPPALTQRLEELQRRTPAQARAAIRSQGRTGDEDTWRDHVRADLI